MKNTVRAVLVAVLAIPALAFAQVPAATGVDKGVDKAADKAGIK